MFNYSQVTLVLDEMTCFPSVNIPMLTTVICLIGQALVYVFGIFIDINRDILNYY